MDVGPPDGMQNRPLLGYKPVIALAMSNAAHFYSICSIFSYAGFLAVDCGWAETEDEAGYTAGLLPTAIMLGRLTMSITYGKLSDRLGRRPCILFSMIAVTLGNFAFGFATDLRAAFAVRFLLLGACNGWAALMGLITLEVSGEAYQAQAFAYIIACGSVVATVGPALGGWTYGLLGSRFPALPPSLVGTALGLCAILVDWAWLPETRPARKPTAAAAKPVDGESAPPAAATTSLRHAVGTWPFPLIMLVRAGHGLVLFAVFEIVPLWSIATRPAGGLALAKGSLAVPCYPLARNPHACHAENGRHTKAASSSCAAGRPSPSSSATAVTASRAVRKPRTIPRPSGQKGSMSASPTKKTRPQQGSSVRFIVEKSKRFVVRISQPSGML